MANTHWWDVAEGIGAGVGAVIALAGIAWTPARAWLDRRIEQGHKQYSFPIVADVAQLKTDMSNLSHDFRQHAADDRAAFSRLSDTLERMERTQGQMERGQAALDTKLDTTHDCVIVLQERVNQETAAIRREQERVAKNLHDLRDGWQGDMNRQAADVRREGTL